jgi:hypothetical protein
MNEPAHDAEVPAHRFGRLLRKYRKDRKDPKITLVALARKASKLSGIGFSAGGLHNLECGNYQKPPRRDVVEALAFALGLSPEETQNLLEAAECLPAQDDLRGDISRAIERAFKVAGPADSATFAQQLTAFCDRFARSIAAREDEVRVAIIPIAGWQARALAPEIIVLSLEPALQEVANAGIREVRLVVAPGLNSNWNRLKAAFPQLHLYFIEQDQPSGLSHALLKGLPEGNRGPVAVLLPDEVDRNGTALRTLVQTYALAHTTLVGVTRLPGSGIVRYSGIAVLNRRDRIDYSARLHKLEEHLREKPQEHGNLPEHSRKIAGRYVLTADIFESIGLAGKELTAALNLSWNSILAYEFQETFMSLSPYQGILDAVKKVGRST